MNKLILLVTMLTLAALACGTGSPTPTLDMHAVETIAAGTLTALAPTQAPPTQVPPTPMPLPTLTLAPTLSSFPTLSSVPIRIQFAPGGISATVQNIVTFPNRVEYVLAASKTQQMTVAIGSESNTANFLVFGMIDHTTLKRLENESRMWTGNLPATQDYLISVAVPSGSTSFTLTVTIVWP